MFWKAGCKLLPNCMGKSFGSLFANMDSKWLRSYERAALYGEVLELMDYSPEIDTNLKVICLPAFKGYCGASCLIWIRLRQLTAVVVVMS